MAIPETELSELRSVASEMNAIGVPWCFCGGWAIDLFLGELTRPHKDVDVAIRRQDQLAVQEHLSRREWSLEIAHQGSLTPWDEGQYLELPYHTIWCRKGKRFLELLFNEWDEESFRYRRNLSISLPPSKACLRAGEFPILAPEVVLLYKSTDLESVGNRHDFDLALPRLSQESRDWLERAMALNL